MNLEAMQQHWGSAAGQAGPGMWDKFKTGFSNYQQGLRQRLSGQAPMMSGLQGMFRDQPQQQSWLSQKNVMPMNQQFGNNTGVSPYRNKSMVQNYFGY